MEYFILFKKQTRKTQTMVQLPLPSLILPRCHVAPSPFESLLSLIFLKSQPAELRPSAPLIIAAAV